MVMLITVLTLLVLHLSTELAEHPERSGLPLPSPVATDEKGFDRYGRLPLAFVANAGQVEQPVRYYTHAGDASFYFTPSEAVFALASAEERHALRLAFLDANQEPAIVGELPGTAKVSYFTGNDPTKWRTGLATYQEVVYRNLWPGIDLAFRGRDGALKYEFRLAPGASPAHIRLAYRGADHLSIDADGGLSIHTPLGIVRDSRPESFQEIAGSRTPVTSNYVLSDAGYGFAVGAYDPTRALVIDPGLVYSTYLGGSATEQGLGIAVDSAGSVYVTGATTSANYPTTVGAFDTTLGAVNALNAFVAKFDSSGDLVYSTYLGGSISDIGADIAVDTLGRAYVIGITLSADFPTTPGAFDTTRSSTDAFVTRLNAFGTGLEYSTYLGGSASEGQVAGFDAFDIDVDSLGNAYVTGITNSLDFPTTPGAFDTTLNSASAVFVTKLNAAGSALVYSTYLEGSGSVNWGFAIAVDDFGGAYVTGITNSANFPTTPGAFDVTFNSPGNEDAFVAKLNPSGTALVYSTYLGGASLDWGMGIAVDESGSAYVTGRTISVDFPTSPGSFDTTLNGGQDVFVTKLNPEGNALVYSTYLGATLAGSGTGRDHGNAIAVDAAGAAYVTGLANSPDFPLTADAVDTVAVGGLDAFLTKLNPAGSSLAYSTYLGGGGDDRGIGVAVDDLGHAFVAGITASSDFPVTPDAYDSTLNGDRDAFIVKLDIATESVPAALTLSSSSSTNPVGATQVITADVDDANGQPLSGVIVRFALTGAVSGSGQCTTEANGRCNFSYQGPFAPGTDQVAAFADSDGDGVQDQGEPSATAGNTWVIGPPADVTVTPQAAVNSVASQHCLTATVSDAFHNPVSGVIVRFGIVGAVNTNGALSSDATGHAVFCYMGPAFPGADDITVHADSDGNGIADAGEPVVRATNTWLLPEATPGEVTGGGQAPTTDAEAEIAFGFNAKSSDGRLNGHCNVVDQAADVHITCVDVTSLVRNGTRASIFGNGSINGNSTIYRIDVEDAAEPGADRDSFRIVTGSGYVAGGLLLRGNIQMR
jgi:hypothetical protein